MSAKRSEAAATKRAAAGNGTFGRSLLRFLALALAVGVGWLAALVVPDPLRPSADAMVRQTAPVSVRIGTYREAGGGIEVAPAGNATARTLLILYPGGLVRPHAYSWIGVGLAPLGIRTLIPTMPLDLAVLGRDRADALLDRLRRGEERVVIAGHSLGGAMAASYAERRPERLDGLVLLGAYPAGSVDLTDLDLPTLVIAAEHDGLATLDQ
ncbi:MAG: alpha/beta fold hydrolase, partial [Trueperaceae bacterium]